MNFLKKKEKKKGKTNKLFLLGNSSIIIQFSERLKKKKRVWKERRKEFRS